MSFKLDPSGVAITPRSQRDWFYTSDSDLRDQVVWGDGYPHAGLMFVGERPGKHEVFRGKPFVGPAGREFDALLSQAGISRQLVYVTNLVKSFRGYEKPTPEEIEEWLPFLYKEISNVKPRTIALVGSYALQGVMGQWWPDMRMATVHGRPWRLPESQTVIVPCYHPGSALYEQRDKYLPMLQHDFRMVYAAHHGLLDQIVDFETGDRIGIRTVGTEISPMGTLPEKKKVGVGQQELFVDKVTDLE